MATRKIIGLSFLFDNHSNSGIVNYIYNIIAALKTVEDKRKPRLIIVYSATAPIDYLKSINYPYIEFREFKIEPSNYLLKKINNKIKYLYKFNMYVFLKYLWRLDYFYPYFGFPFDSELEFFKKKIYWLVDFNNLAYPDYYEDKGIFMTNYQQNLTATSETIVLSSISLLDELKAAYPQYKNQVKILRFASTLPELKANPQILLKYNVSKPFLISPNQFWEHKNQLTLLKAIAIVAKEHPELQFQVVFTGSIAVNRGKGLYLEKIKVEIDQSKLERYVRLLGVIERQDQLGLMNESAAIIQPSLYEGWSTLVEEAKALNKFIILTDLPVHKEQLDKNCAFFEAKNEKLLAEMIFKQLTSPATVQYSDYQENIKQFGNDILDIFK